MSVDQGLVDRVADMVAVLGVPSSRRMMGGTTLYCDGIPYAIVDDDLLWFKADTASDPQWDEAGAAKFSYERDGKTATMNYRRAPDDCYDDDDVFRHWAELALAAGRRAAAKKAARRR
ncbi:TfoX/Sxy family protein [Sphingomonas cynarae]|uniref:TfoX/Sxy family protein n=1 Tax=Sphingomonas cynarae TaxID=930197 RepID=A0ABP7EXD9_9SPHN